MDNMDTNRRHGRPDQGATMPVVQLSTFSPPSIALPAAPLSRSTDVGGDMRMVHCAEAGAA